MLGYIDEVGLSKSGMAGIVPIDWADIESWVNVTDTCLETWEAKAIMNLSREYCYQFSISSDPKCPPPYNVNYDEGEMNAVRETAEETVRGLF